MTTATATKTDMTVSTTILEQLGGRMFIMMTGSKNFVGSDNSLSFKVGSNPKHITHVRITLTPDDLYTVEFMKIRKMDVNVVSKVEGVYFDMLQDLFTGATGLYTRL